MRTFRSCLNPLFQSEAKCEATEMEMNFFVVVRLCPQLVVKTKYTDTLMKLLLKAVTILKQIKLIFKRKVLHLASF